MKYDDGYVIILNEVVRDKTLEPIDKIVYSYVVGYNTYGRECFSSNDAICDNLGISILTLRRSIARLQGKGLLLVFNKINRKSGNTVARILECANAYAKDVKRDNDKYIYKQINYNGKYLSRTTNGSCKE